MDLKNSHCSFCGAMFPPSAPWPRGCAACGQTTYLNPLPVAVVLLPVGDGVIVIRRNTEPQKGTLTLPGGYIDAGESWQDAASRELLEETGIAVAASDISLYDVQNGLDDTLVVFGLAARQPQLVYGPFSSAETQEVVLIEAPQELGFAMHTRVVERFFREKGAPGASSGSEPTGSSAPGRDRPRRLAAAEMAPEAAAPAAAPSSAEKHATAEWKAFVQSVMNMCGGSREEFHLFNRQDWRQAVYSDKTGLEYWEWVAVQIDDHIEKARQAGYAVVEDPDQPGSYRLRAPDGTVGDVADETEDEAWCRAGLHLEGK
jgi:ADP-ribose pyrophosphatase YjhB (NUDIX family)